jgi:hypothetical protein
VKKTLILLSLILLTTGLLSANEPLKHHAFKVGYGGMFLGGGDLVGPTLDFEYTYWLHKYLGISPRIIFGTFNEPTPSTVDGIDNQKFYHYNVAFTHTYDIRITLNPFFALSDRFSANIGLSFRHKNGAKSDAYRQYDKNGGYEEHGMLGNYPIYEDEDIIGYTVGIDMKIINREKINVGTKAGMHKYDGNYYRDIAWSISAYLGFEL